jgi:hypothetical protein
LELDEQGFPIQTRLMKIGIPIVAGPLTLGMSQVSLSAFHLAEDYSYQNLL